MKRLILFPVICLIVPISAAQANVPSAKWQRDALAAAQGYWHYASPWDPACQMTISYGPIGDLTEAGETDANCNVIMNSNLDWVDPEILCLDVTHEVGHVILGPDAFPDNPADPSHSTDPANIMYPVIFDATIAECATMLNKEFPPVRRNRWATHHRKRRAHARR